MRYIAEPSDDELFLTQKFKTQLFYHKNFPIYGIRSRILVPSLPLKHHIAKHPLKAGLLRASKRVTEV